MARGRPRKIINENTILKENKMSDEYLPAVHHFLRYWSKSDRTNELTMERSTKTLDEEASAWVAKGYRLQASFYIGEVPEGYGMIHVFVKE